MTYRQCFDRLGNPCYRRASSRVHRVLQIMGGVATVVLLVLIYRPF